MAVRSSDNRQPPSATPHGGQMRSVRSHKGLVISIASVCLLSGAVGIVLFAKGCTSAQQPQGPGGTGTAAAPATDETRTLTPGWQPQAPGQEAAATGGGSGGVGQPQRSLGGAAEPSPAAPAASSAPAPRTATSAPSPSGAKPAAKVQPPNAKPSRGSPGEAGSPVAPGSPRLTPGAAGPGGGGGGAPSKQDTLKLREKSNPAAVRPDNQFGDEPDKELDGGAGFGKRGIDEMRRSRFNPTRLPTIPGGQPSQFEEVWVISRPEGERKRPSNDESPGGGCLITSIRNPAGVQQVVTVPLAATEVTADIVSYIASVNVKQIFSNPYAEKIEAVYVFPLPENAAVNDFVMTVGDRRIRGVIRDKEEAKVIYENAKSQGYAASLLEQNRPNIFTQKVANIEPGKQIDVDITYFSTLACSDGEFEFAFPLVVGPRFNPAGFYGGIGAVSTGAPATASGSRSGQPAEQQYLSPGKVSSHKVSITARIDGGGLPVERVRSDSHIISTQRGTGSTAGKSQSHSQGVITATLSPNDASATKDFVLKWKLGGNDGKNVRTSVATFTGSDGDRYFSMLLLPPERLGTLKRGPVEMVFVLDCSGSMDGRPIEQAVMAADRALRRLEPGDTFQIINFANTASQLGAAPLPATADNIAKGSTYLKSLFAQGGTYMINGLRASLDFPHDPQRLRYVAFLTDGYIGNEAEILTELHGRLGDSRIFSFGVGSSTNRYLLDAMAKVGRGCVAHIAAGDNPVTVMDAFTDRVMHPALTDMQLSINGRVVATAASLGDDALGGPAGIEVFPRQLPDVYVGRPVVITGRIPATSGGDSELNFKVSGRAAGVQMEFPTKAIFGTAEARQGGLGLTQRAALPALWARRKIADMADYAGADARRFAEEVKAVALRYNLMSAYTSFVAVDSMTRTGGSSGVTVQVPVPMPDGVRYETTVTK